MTAIPYPFKVRFVLTDRTEKLEEKANVYHKGDVFAHTYMGPDHDGRKVITVIINPKNKYSQASLTDVAHECIHVKNFIYGSVSQYLDTENDEAEAYFFTWVLKQAYEFYQKYLPAIGGPKSSS